MFALFLESRAAEEVRQYVQVNPDFQEDELLKRTYERAMGSMFIVAPDWMIPVGPFDAEQQQECDDWWVLKCLHSDSHKRLDVDSLFCWSDTIEGHDFWKGVSKRDDVAAW